MSTYYDENTMSEYNKNRIKLNIILLRRQPEEKAKHEAGDYMDDNSHDTKDDSVSSDPLVLIFLVCLNWTHLIL